MKRVVLSLILAVFLISVISAAEITLSESPKGPFNIGDVVNTNAKISTLEDLKSSLDVYVICNGLQNTVFSKDIILSSGEQETIALSFILTKERLGRTTGHCVVKFSLEGFEPEITEEFEVSNLIILEILSNEEEFKPGESVLVEGEAIKENGEAVKSGFVNLEIREGNSSVLTKTDTVRNGFFSVNISLPNDLKAGKYIIAINVYEIDKYDERTNQGFGNYNLQILQVPTSLEILFNNQEVEPGTSLQVKAILHDQTGEKIESNAVLTVKNNKSEIFEQTEKMTDELFELPIAYNQPPAVWKVLASSNGLTSEATFTIQEKEGVKVELINESVTITNVGNVPYNRSLIIKIGNESLKLDVYLEVDKVQKYILTAPDGEYHVEVMDDEEKIFSERTMLTGKVIDIKEGSGVGLLRYPFVWIFIILVLGFVLFMVFTKGYKRSFFGRFLPGKRKRVGEMTGRGAIGEKLISSKSYSGSLMSGAKNKAELSLSLKGDKQNTSVVCIKIKNLKDIDLRKGNVLETLQNVINIAENSKAFTYENQDNIFFIIAPIKTKTFKNERIAVDVAEKISEFLKDYNKLAKQKIEFGVSLHTGQIVAKQDKDRLKFMSLGTLINTAKKLSAVSEGEVLLSKEAREKLLSDVKTEKCNMKDVEAYIIKDIRKVRGEDKKFISEFLKRLEGGKK